MEFFKHSNASTQEKTSRDEPADGVLLLPFYKSFLSSSGNLIFMRRLWEQVIFLQRPLFRLFTYIIEISHNFLTDSYEHKKNASLIFT